MKKLELHDQFLSAFDLLEHSQKNIFVTGRAGTGKSTLLTYFRQHTRKNIAVLAPTGVAALNVAGQTIHSFFKFRPDITPQTIKKPKFGGELYKALDAIVIDEISMVRADLLDCIDQFMQMAGPRRGHPFGGVQMIFIGDLFQLPPVVTFQERALFTAGHYESPYFFSAHVVTGGPQQTLLKRVPFEMEFLELQKIFRQTDEIFIRTLNNIRANTAGAEDFELLNSRLQQNFVPPPKIFYIHVTTTNARAKEINEIELQQLKGEERSYQGTRDGAFDTGALPTDEFLRVKIGAQIMMLNNDSTGRWVNGTIGKISDIERGASEGMDVLWVKLENGEEVSVTPHTWDLFRFQYDSAARAITSESAGTFTQYPLKLAWAVTIHKSQGKTFEHVILDVAGGTFSPGQLYVALSRATSLEGLVLKKPLAPRHVFVDPKVVAFCARF